jgi:hypothetical protein
MVVTVVIVAPGMMVVAVMIVGVMIVGVMIVGVMIVGVMIVAVMIVGVMIVAAVIIAVPPAPSLGLLRDEYASEQECYECSDDDFHGDTSPYGGNAQGRGAGCGGSFRGACRSLRT